MTPERWQQVKTTLASALEYEDQTERATYVARACEDDTALRREIESLLAQPDDEFETVGQKIGAAAAEPLIPSDIGRKIGNYELVRELGRGGMGTVWLARRADQHFEKLVAIKLLKRGTDTEEVLGRFQAERRILARLDHPNIAHLLDAGETEDHLPYFVMEYVAGDRVTDHVRAQKLSLPERLGLFLKICSAVQFAHQNLVVHRDLKPGNILVTADGEPKLLDFGVAKLLADGDDLWQMTMPGRERFTPGYASPEQVRGEPITTVTDVYSLGAILYEILTGTQPHRFPTGTPTAPQIEKVVCAEELPRPSSIATDPEMRRRLRGDLDTILLRALAKSPERRYRGAGNFADDIRRHLDQKPVHARPDTFAYRSGKLLRRNKKMVAAAGLILTAILAGSIGTYWQATRAQRRFNQVRKIANSLLFEFHDAIRDLPGALQARQLVTRRALQYLDSLAQDAGNDLSLKSELAIAYDKLGGLTFDTRQAIESHEKAAALNEALVRAEPNNALFRKQLAHSYAALGDTMKISGHSGRAIEYARHAIGLTEKLAAEFPNDPEVQGHLTERYLSLSVALRDAGDAQGALASASKANEVQAAIVARRPSDVEERHALAGVLGDLSDACADLSDLSSALNYSARQFETVKSVLATDPSNARYRRTWWSACLRRARLLAATGEIQGALENFTRARETIESLSGADPEDIGHRRWLGVTYREMGEFYAAQARFDEASELDRKAIALSEQLVQQDPERIEAVRDLMRAYQSLSAVLANTNQSDAASEYLKKSAALAEQLIRRDPDNQRVRARLARIQGDLQSISR